MITNQIHNYILRSFHEFIKSPNDNEKMIDVMKEKKKKNVKNVNKIKTENKQTFNKTLINNSLIYSNITSMSISLNKLN